MDSSVVEKIANLLNNIEHDAKGSLVISGECFDLIKSQDSLEKIDLIGIVNLDDGIEIEGIGQTTSAPIVVGDSKELNMGVISQDQDHIVLSVKQAKSLVEALQIFIKSNEGN